MTPLTGILAGRFRTGGRDSRTGQGRRTGGMWQAGKENGWRVRGRHQLKVEL